MPAPPWLNGIQRVGPLGHGEHPVAPWRSTRSHASPAPLPGPPSARPGARSPPSARRSCHTGRARGPGSRATCPCRWAGCRAYACPLSPPRRWPAAGADRRQRPATGGSHRCWGTSTSSALRASWCTQHQSQAGSVQGVSLIRCMSRPASGNWWRTQGGTDRIAARDRDPCQCVGQRPAGVGRVRFGHARVSGAGIARQPPADRHLGLGLHRLGSSAQCREETVKGIVHADRLRAWSASARRPAGRARLS